MRELLGSLFVVVVAGGCMAAGSARYSATVTAPPPLVYVSSGVQVVEDYDQPIFYSSDMYWRYDGGVWYRSNVYNGGWARVSTVPGPILQIQQPAAYVHFHGAARAAVVTEHRDPPATPARSEQREDQADKREMKEEQREMKEEKRDDKRDDKPGKPEHTKNK